MGKIAVLVLVLVGRVSSLPPFFCTAKIGGGGGGFEIGSKKCGVVGKREGFGY